MSRKVIVCIVHVVLCRTDILYTLYIIVELKTSRKNATKLEKTSFQDPQEPQVFGMH